MCIFLSRLLTITAAIAQTQHTTLFFEAAQQGNFQGTAESQAIPGQFYVPVNSRILPRRTPELRLW